MKAVQLSFINQLIEGLNTSQNALNQDEQKPETYKGIYSMHKYWSKKPYNLVDNYIEDFSNPGDIVLDSFCGSGVTIIESVRLKRRAISIDINPIAIFITKMGLAPIDIHQLKQSFEALKREVRPLIDRLYFTVCPQCQNPDAIATHDGHPSDLAHKITAYLNECAGGAET